jgi:hypothetical protein
VLVPIEPVEPSTVRLRGVVMPGIIVAIRYLLRCDGSTCENRTEQEETIAIVFLNDESHMLKSGKVRPTGVA